jgi:glycerol dehydrogenase-like iron-containing ADH family enzyme
MSGLAKGLAAGLAGAAAGALGAYADKKAADKKNKPAASTPTAPAKPAANAPSYSIAHDMRQSGADTQTPDTE